jgi:hypothetical protein
MVHLNFYTTTTDLANILAKSKCIMICNWEQSPNLTIEPEPSRTILKHPYAVNQHITQDN